jgi:galactokinase
MEPVKIPSGILFFGLDSGVRHAVSGASYSQVRTAAFMAYTVLLRTMGIESAMIEKARVSQDWDQLPFKGFLANISLEEFEQQYASKIPETMSGEHFIKDYGSSIDTITVVNPSTEYHLLNAAYHPVRENHRVKRFMELLKQFETSEDRKLILREMGELMLGSHQGYSSVGLGEPVTQMIVDKVLEHGEDDGVYGARISGGGSGGTVVIIADTEKGINTVKEIRSFMQKKTGRELYLFSGSSEGAHFINTAI